MHKSVIQWIAIGLAGVSLILWFQERSERRQLNHQLESLEDALSRNRGASPSTSTSAILDICPALGGRIMNQNGTTRCDLGLNEHLENIHNRMANYDSRLDALTSRSTIPTPGTSTAVPSTTIRYEDVIDPRAPRPPKNAVGGGAETQFANGSIVCGQAWGQGQCFNNKVECRQGKKKFFRAGASPQPNAKKTHYICL
ncbi:MAG: hypothetical protein AAGB31_05495 [Bdellovibrio sp.]